MARLWTDGGEFGTRHTQLYTAYSASPPTVVTTTPPTGSYQWEFDGGVGQAMRKDVYAADADRILYAHTKFTLVTAVDVACAILHNVSAAPSFLAVFVNTDNTLQLYAFIAGSWIAQGAASSALSTGTVYRVEWKLDAPGNSMTLRVNDTDIATVGAGIGTLGGPNNGISFELGNNPTTVTVGACRMDDIIINDDTGSFQNTWVGVQAINMYMPNGAGDNAQWTPSAGANWQNVDEVPADDGTTLNSTNTLGNIDDYAMAATGLPADEVIDCVQLCNRWNVVIGIGGISGHVLRIKASAGGTVEESAELDKTTGWQMFDTAEPKLYNLTLYDLPGASTTPWTPADLDAAQAGVRCSTAAPNAVRNTIAPIVVSHHAEMRVFQQASEPLREPLEVVAY